MKDLSIIIVNFNGELILKDCLSSVINNTKKISYEIIIVDNASTDNSINLIKSDYKQVKLIENKHNLGFAKANNQAIRYCSGKYIMLLNNDTQAIDRAFDKLVAFLEDHHEAGAIGPKLLNTDMSIQRQGSLMGSKFWRSEHPSEVDFLSGACFIIRKDVFDKVGLLDENLLIYNEDLDICKRIRKAKHKIIYLPDAEVIHFGSFGSRHFNKVVFIEGFRGGLYFCRKHYGIIAYTIYRLILPVGLLLMAIISFLGYLLKPKHFISEYPKYLASLWEIFKIDLFGKIIPPKQI